MPNLRKNIAIILSGCGVKDGSEIHESVLTMLAITRAGMTYQCFAPDIAQHHVTNHLTGQQVKESRNVLVEAARIARGKIKALSQFKPQDFDAVILPGGFGAAANLCTFVEKGADCAANLDVARAIKGMFAVKKPIGALCIAPVILAKLIPGALLTAGDDQDVHAAMQKMGAKTKITACSDVLVDEDHKIVTVPCYMYDATIDQVALGAEHLVQALGRMMQIKLS